MDAMLPHPIADCGEKENEHATGQRIGPERRPAANHMREGAPMEVSSASIISRLCRAGRWRYHTAAATNAAKGIEDPDGARNVPGSIDVPRGTRSPLRSKPRRAPSTSTSHVTTMNAAESRTPNTPS